MTLFDIDVFKFDLNVLELVNLPMIGLMIMASSSIAEASVLHVLIKTTLFVYIFLLQLKTSLGVAVVASAHFVLVKLPRYSIHLYRPWW